MIITWSVVVLLVVGVAAMLAMADGALLAAGHIGPRKFIPNPERAHRSLLRARVIAHLVIGTGIALVTSSVISHTVLAIGVAAMLVLASVTAVEAMALAEQLRSRSDRTVRMQSHAVLDRFNDRLWQLTRHALRDHAAFNEDDHSFALRANPFPEEVVHPGGTWRSGRMSFSTRSDEEC